MVSTASQFGFAEHAVADEAPKRKELRGKGSLSEDRVQLDSPDPRTSLAKTITVEPGTRIEKVTVTIGAKPVGIVEVAKVAEVRKDPEGAIIDFGRMRTVNGLNLGSTTASEVFPWQGAAFSIRSVSSTTPVPTTFGEVLTERLRVVSNPGAAAVTVALARAAQVSLPGAPSDLEVTVAGRRIFLQSGEAKRPPDAKPGDYFVAVIDATDAVKAAAGAGPDVPIELRAATAGLLSLETKVTRTRVHEVQFPEGTERVLTFVSEGTATLELPLPGGADDWRVAEVGMKATAKLGAQRIIPAIGPAASTEAELVLDADHPIALQITADELDSFGAIAGVRLQAQVEDGAAEIAGVLLADVSGAPGESLPGGDLTPVQLAAGTFAWQTLALRKPLRLDGRPLWLALQVAHGRLSMKLAASGGGEILRGRPGGPWRGFSKGVAITPRAALRVVGEARDDIAMYALAATLPGAPQVVLVPTAAGVELQIVPSPPIHPSGSLQIALTAIAPGIYRFGEVQVFYRLASEETA